MKRPINASRIHVAAIMFLFLIAGFLLLFRLGRSDIVTDDGHYAFRSIGYVDYVASLRQTTPIQWFGSRPWWSYLSFHDHPPLFFLIQHIFFWLFGLSIVVSRLPSALAALGSIIAVYFLAKNLWGQRAAVATMAALAVNSYFVWMGRVGLLESLFTFFLLMGLLFLVRSENQPRHYITAGVFLGLSILTKYTFFAALPGIVIYLLWQRRADFRRRWIYTGLMAFILACLPIVVYNLGMYYSRGHFDVQFADIFGQSRADWPILGSRVGFYFFDAIGVARMLGEGYSWPYFALVVAALAAWAVSVIRARGKGSLPGLVFISMCLFFMWVGSAQRWLGVISPFAALLIGNAFGLLQERISKTWGRIMIGGGVLAALFFLFYAVNTNLLIKPVGNRYIYAPQFRSRNAGYNQLDRALTSILSGKRSEAAVAHTIGNWWYSEIKPESINFSSIRQGSVFSDLIIMDSASDWFADIWTLDRWRFYHRIFIIKADEYLRLMGNQDTRQAFAQLPFTGAYIIRTDNPAIRAKAPVDEGYIDFIISKLVPQGTKPQAILNDQGEAAFSIYHLDAH